MGFLTRYLEQRDAHPRAPAQWMIEMFGGRSATSGVRVNETTAMSWTALSAAVRFLAEAMASMPLEVMRYRKGGGREAARELGIYRLLRDQPNPEMSSFEWRELSQTHILLWGNAYSHIVWNRTNEPVELWPLNPDRVQVRRDSFGNITYHVSIPSDDLTVSRSEYRILAAEDVLHIRGPSRYGFLGERIAQVYPEAIGLGLASEEFGARLFGSGMNASGVLEHPGLLSEAAKKRMETSLQRQAGGLSRAHRTLILEEGMKWTQTTIEPEKAQFLGLRTFQVQEASRILRVPPHLIYELSRATFSNIEHQGIEVVVYTILPWVRRWEQRLNMQLISTKMQNTLYTRFEMNGFLRGDTQARYNAYHLARQDGWLSPNDIRELEDMNPIPGGDEYLEPVNMRPLGSEPTPPPAPPAPMEAPNAQAA